jgi:hypothetical protein
MPDVKVSVGLRRETSEDYISEFVDPILKQLFGVDSRTHLATNQLRNVLNVENLFLSSNCLGLFVHFLLLNGHIIGQSPGLPALFEYVLQQLTLHEGDLVLHLTQKLKFL